ncbi:MAG: TIR domain-containing protein [Pseudomonadota bacterium]
MSHLFLSYASEDRERVRPLAALLEQCGHSVWWDQELNPGVRFQQAIDDALRRADRVLVLWSEHSIESAWVHAEASEGLERNVLVPVLLDAVRPPLPFRHHNAAALTRWQGSAEDPEFQRLLRAIDAPALTSAETLTPPERRRPRANRPALWLAGAALIALALWLALPQLRPVAQPQASIAITEIVQRDTGERNYLGYGFAGQVRDLLSRVDGLAVASRTATDALAGKDPRSLADLLRVRYLLEGTVSGDAQRFRLELQLVDSNTGYRVWSEGYSGDLQQLLELAYETARRVLQTLEIDTASAARLRSAARVTENPDALDAWLLGTELLHRPPDESVLTRAQAQFERALTLDPTFAGAHAGLCQVLLERYQGSRIKTQFEDGAAACERALQLDSNQIPALIALGQLRAVSGDFERATQTFRTALEQAPLQPEPVVGLGRAYAATQDNERSERWFQKAVRDFPGYPDAHSAYGGFLLGNGRLREAAAAFEAVVELFPGSATAYSDLGASYLLLGRFEAALTAWATAQDLEENALAHANIGTAHFFLGDMRAARDAYEAAAALNPEDNRYQSLLGDACRMLSDETCAATAFRNASEMARTRLQINPSDADAHSMLAMSLAHLGDTTGSNEHAQQALTLASEDFYVRYDLAVAAMRLGDTPAAKSHLEAALRLGYPAVLADADPQLQLLTVASQSASPKEGTP